MATDLMPRLTRAARPVAIVACTLALASACGSRSASPPVVVAIPPDAAPSVPSDTEVAEPPDADAAPARTAATPVAESAACRLGPENGEPVASIGLTDTVDAEHAPYPLNASESLVFRQLYESPLRIDCEGEPRPALAESWQVEPDGTWTLTLRPDVRFTDGIPVTADAVMTAWTEGGTNGSEVRAGRHVVSVAVLDARRVGVRLREGVSAPAVFAHPDLAVVRRVPTAMWAIGTRGFRPESDLAPAPATGRMRLTLVRQPPAPAAPDGSPEPPQAIQFLIAPASDPRDLLDEGLDLLVTRDRRTLQYAETLERYETIPLPWDLMYVLASRATGPLQPLSTDARDTLARDAVRGEARGAATPDWLDTIAACPALQTPVAPAGSPAMRRIVFDAADETARDLAERIVGLAGTRSPNAAAMLDGLLPRSHQALQRAIGLTGQALASALKNGSDAGYVLAFTRTSIHPCDDVAALLRRTPWVDPQALVPIVETRARAVLRRSRSGLVHDGDGAILFDLSGPDDGRRPE